MNLCNSVSDNIEYIQRLFLRVQLFMQENRELEELIAFLNTEPAEFRSVAYESASMEIGLQELSGGKEWNSWRKFYQCSAKAHTFHMEIGLGWAFAKAGLPPTPYLQSQDLFMGWMVFDGIGYYHGLFKGRRTVKNQLVPEVIREQELNGFDQGLGRRLWYIAKGEVKSVTDLIRSFPSTRHPDLWRGVGIACGYVGGNKQTDIELLLTTSGACINQLRTGIALAAISRNASDSVTRDIELACEVICGQPLKELLGIETGLRKQFN